jgi:hypothetical protein
MKMHTPHDISEWVLVSVMILSFPNCLRRRVEVVHSCTAGVGAPTSGHDSGGETASVDTRQ